MTIGLRAWMIPGLLLLGAFGPINIRTSIENKKSGIRPSYSTNCHSDGSAACALIGYTHPPMETTYINSISSGSNHTCAIAADLSVECWGAMLGPNLAPWTVQ